MMRKPLTCFGKKFQNLLAFGWEIDCWLVWNYSSKQFLLLKLKCEKRIKQALIGLLLFFHYIMHGKPAKLNPSVWLLLLLICLYLVSHEFCDVEENISMKSWDC